MTPKVVIPYDVTDGTININLVMSFPNCLHSVTYLYKIVQDLYENVVQYKVSL